MFFVSAATTGYAWSNNAGWINFGCDNCGVTVSSSGITGYAWSESYGWINLAPSNGGVYNTNSGALSGYAWGESMGWINFGTATINCSGLFRGTATGDIVGTVNFECSGCNVQTSWRPSINCGGSTVIYYSLTTNSNHGSVSPSSGSYASGTSVSLTATPNSGYIFSSWSGDLSGTENPKSIIMNSDKSVVANFTFSATCNNASDCGTDGYSGDVFCKDGNVYQNYVTYACSNPGQINSACSNSSVGQLKTTCSENKTCYQGLCQSVTCSQDSGCGLNGYTGNAFCDSGNIYRNYTIYTCSAPGQAESLCSSSSESRLQAACGSGQSCIDGACVDSRKHNECSGSQCILVDGDGDNQCSTNSDCSGNFGSAQSHNECNDKQQCLSISGSGDSECQQDADCKTPEIIRNIENITNNITNQITQNVVEPVKIVADETKKIINTPEGSVATKAISTTGLVVATAATAGSLVSFSFLEIFLIPVRLFGLLLTALGIKKRIIPWGVAYDSVTKRPLDPAYVTLKDFNGKEISSTVTDLDGRYGFLVAPGVYYISALKTNYKFPSEKLAGKQYDELHNNLYFGEPIEVKATGDVIIKNIPLDPVKFDWNEFAKKDKKLMRFYSEWDIVLRRIYDIFFALGFVVAIIAYTFAPYPYNLLMMFLYLFMLILRAFGIKPKTYGYVIEQSTGAPLSFAIIRVFPPQGIAITSKSADKYGKYYCLVPPGKYYVKIEKKNNDESYSLVYTSVLINVSRKGIIKERFKV